jgi:hypothetical protein
MVDIGGENNIKHNKKLVVGSAELNFKRDGMEIESLFNHETGISKLRYI